MREPDAAWDDSGRGGGGGGAAGVRGDRAQRPGFLLLLPPDKTVKAMVTEMSIGEEDFQQLQAQEGVAITFCLKEFRVSVPPTRSPPCPPGPAQAHCSASPLPGTPDFRRVRKLVS